MRSVDVSIVTRNIKEMCIQANHFLSEDMDIAMKNAVETEDAENTGVLEFVIPAAMTVLTAGLSVILVNRNLKQEPIELLSARVE